MIISCVRGLGNNPDHGQCVYNSSFSATNRRDTVRDISLHDNVIIDSGWMGLLQVNNTIL
jgi:hypothetical protein